MRRSVFRALPHIHTRIRMVMEVGKTTNQIHMANPLARRTPQRHDIEHE